MDNRQVAAAVGVLAILAGATVLVIQQANAGGPGDGDGGGGGGGGSGVITVIGLPNLKFVRG